MKTYIRNTDSVSVAITEGEETIQKFLTSEYSLVECTNIPSDWDEGKYIYKENTWSFVGPMYFTLKQHNTPGFVITKPEVL